MKSILVDRILPERLSLFVVLRILGLTLLAFIVCIIGASVVLGCIEAHYGAIPVNLGNCRVINTAAVLESGDHSILMAQGNVSSDGRPPVLHTWGVRRDGSFVDLAYRGREGRQVVALLDPWKASVPVVVKSPTSVVSMLIMLWNRLYLVAFAASAR